MVSYHFWHISQLEFINKVHLMISTVNSCLETINLKENRKLYQRRTSHLNSISALTYAIDFGPTSFDSIYKTCGRVVRALHSHIGYPATGRRTKTSLSLIHLANHKTPGTFLTQIKKILSERFQSRKNKAFYSRSYCVHYLKILVYNPTRAKSFLKAK